MQDQFYNQNSVVSQIDNERGFKKSSSNTAIEGNPQFQSQFKKLPTYTYQPIEFNNPKQTNNLFESGENRLKSPNNLYSFTNTNFNQRPTSAIDPYSNIKSKEEQRMKVMYQDINYSTNRYEPYVPEIQQPKRQSQVQVQTFFSKYSKGEGYEFGRTKSSSQIVVPKQDTFTKDIYSGLSFNSQLPSPKSNNQFKNETTYSQGQQYKSRILRLQRELTQISIQKGELILQLAQLSRENNHLQKEVTSLRQNQYNPVLVYKTNSDKVQIDKDLLYEIQLISQQQKEINKIKEQYIQLASVGYQQQIKRLMQQNNSQKLEIQSLNFDLSLVKQDLEQKQLKIDFLLKEMANTEQKSKGNSKTQTQMTERYNQILTLKHSLSALQSKYKAQSRQLASKQDYILKYIVGRSGNQDLQAIQGLVTHTTPFMMKQSDDMSEIQSYVLSNYNLLGNMQNSRGV